jgi:RRXRR protein
MTSLLNIDEERNTSERMVHVMFVYVLNCHAQPLMPCQLRKTRYRPPRFLNRRKPNGWFAPSVHHQVDAHIKAIRLVHTLLPVSKTTIEVA